MEVSKKESLSYHEDTELRLGLPGTDNQSKKRAYSDINKETASDPSPPKKVQAIGWPPIRSFRKNSLQIQATKQEEEEGRSTYVKVSMDGAPYLRKVDLKLYKGYKEMLKALEGMFKLKTGILSDRLENGSEYKPTYEDKDGDWMLVGDVPLEMFISSCKRLRIMKGYEPN